MLSGKLIHLIEAHSDQIITNVIHDIRQDPELVHLRELPEAELRECGQEILENLDHWLAKGSEEEVARRYEALGRLRFEETIPLYEVVRKLCILKEQTIDFVLGQGIAKTPVQLYAEEELERRVGRFFDVLLFHLVRGYERAWQRTRRAVA